MIENLNGFNPGDAVLFVHQLEALRAVAEIHSHFPFGEELNNDVKTEVVRVADSHHVFPNFSREFDRCIMISGIKILKNLGIMEFFNTHLQKNIGGIF
jgi:hypothetical protein